MYTFYLRSFLHHRLMIIEITKRITIASVGEITKIQGQLIIPTNFRTTNTTVNQLNKPINTPFNIFFLSRINN